jgi:isochorismate synthase
MHLNGDEATLFAGGGITSKSDPETEWSETEAKLRTIKSVL